jgi:hypothetical protein
MHRRHTLILAGLIALLGPTTVFYAAEPPAGLAYAIILRSRQGEVTPVRTPGTQTGGGSLLVEQPEPHTIVITMGGAAVVGSDCGGASASIDFNLEQDLDIVALRAGARPPRIGMVGRVFGTLVVSDPRCCGKCCGSAENGTATACLSPCGGTGLLSVSVKPSAVCCGQELAVNHQEGPVELAAAAGSYRLTGSFHIGATQGKGVFHRQYAVADFDPAPQLDAFWADALKTFRAIPRRDFGFKLVVRVVEDAAPIAAGKAP